jgi:predicted MFS family arabinose efflux permease
VEQTRYKVAGRSKTNIRLLLFFGIMMFVGFLAFDYIPKSFYNMKSSASVLKASFFMIAFLVFINVHHYFIDNVLWRFKNREVRELLFD